MFSLVRILVSDSPLIRLNKQKHEFKMVLMYAFKYIICKITKKPKMYR